MQIVAEAGENAHMETRLLEAFLFGIEKWEKGIKTAENALIRKKRLDRPNSQALEGKMTL